MKSTKALTLFLSLFTFTLLQGQQRLIILTEFTGIQLANCDLENNIGEGIDVGDLGGPINSFAVDESTGNIYVTKRFDPPSLSYINPENPGEVTVIFEELENPYGLHIDQINQKLYWLERNMLANVLLKRANLDGTEVEVVTTFDVNISFLEEPVDFVFLPQENAIFTTGTAFDQIQRIDLETLENTTIRFGDDLKGLDYWEAENKLVYIGAVGLDLFAYTLELDGSDGETLFMFEPFSTLRVNHFDFDEENEIFYCVGSTDRKVFTLDINGNILQDEICDPIPGAAASGRYTYVTIVDDLETSTISITEEADFQIYPNPNFGQFDLRIPERLQQEVSLFQITNINGQVVYRSSSVANLRELRERAFAPGLYLTTIITQSGQQLSKKMIIQR
ncbi:MAG: T9SS type A sorting domain-containing protein [Bacteroidota bacterium]